MLELDIILSGLAERLELMPEDELSAASELLELEDSELWDMLVLKKLVPRPSISSLVASLTVAPELA